MSGGYSNGECNIFFAKQNQFLLLFSFYNKRNMVHGHSRVSQFMGHRAHIHTRTRTYINAALRSFRSGSDSCEKGHNGFLLGNAKEVACKILRWCCPPIFLSFSHSLGLPLTLCVCVCTVIHKHVCLCVCGGMYAVYFCVYVCKCSCLCLPVCPHWGWIGCV